MWFCEMRQMPRLRDCAYELAAQLLWRVRDLFPSFKHRLAARDRGRVDLIAPDTSRARYSGWARSGS
jgi:hypothetical protein